MLYILMKRTIIENLRYKVPSFNSGQGSKIFMKFPLSIIFIPWDQKGDLKRLYPIPKYNHSLTQRGIYFVICIYIFNTKFLHSRFSELHSRCLTALYNLSKIWNKMNSWTRDIYPMPKLKHTTKMTNKIFCHMTHNEMLITGIGM